MSDKLGPLRYSANEEEIFLGHSVTQQKNISEATAEVIDSEVRRLVDDADAHAREVITTHLDQLHAIAKALLDYETLTGDELKAVMRGESIDRSDKDDAAADAGAASAVPSTEDAQTARTSPGGFEPEPQPGS